MNKILKKLALATLASTLLVGCSSVTLAEKGSIIQENIDFNPKSVVGYVGDVMPFYEDGMMNIFYLQDGRNTSLGFHPFALMTTTDLVSYHDYGMVIPYVDNIYDQDFALGTGSVIKGNDGLYHCFYTGHNSYKNSGLPFKEKIQHATSTDKINWTKIPKDGFYGASDDFRDPYVYYSDRDSTYYMLVTTKENNCGVIKQYSSKDLSSWLDRGVFFKNDSGTHNMECPTFIEYNGYYYLSYSEQGDNRVTHYRYKKNLSDDWIKPENDYFDSEGFYAARMEKGFDKLLIFGWVATKTGEYDGGDFDWGGNLVSHELVQKENGELSCKGVSNILDKLNNQVEYKLNDGKKLDELSFSSGEKKAYLVEELSSNVTRLNFKLTLNEKKGDAGLCFNSISDNILSSLLVSFDFDANMLYYYNKVSGFNDYGNYQLYIPFEFNKDTEYNVDILINGEILTVYLDEKVALTTRIYDMPEEKFSFYSNQSNIKMEGIKFYE